MGSDTKEARVVDPQQVAARLAGYRPTCLFCVHWTVTGFPVGVRNWCQALKKTQFYDGDSCEHFKKRG